MMKLLLSLLFLMMASPVWGGQETTHVVILKSAAGQSTYQGPVELLSNNNGISPFVFDDGHAPTAWRAVAGKFDVADLAALAMDPADGTYVAYDHPNTWGPAAGWTNNTTGLDKISWTDHGYDHRDVWARYPIPGAMVGMSTYGYPEYAGYNDQLSTAGASGYNLAGESYQSVCDVAGTGAYESYFGVGDGVWCEHTYNNVHMYTNPTWGHAGSHSPVASSGTSVFTKDGSVNYCSTSFGPDTDFYPWIAAQSYSGPMMAAYLARVRAQKTSYNLWDARAALRQTSYNYVQAEANPSGYTGGGVWMGATSAIFNAPSGGGGYGLLNLEAALGLSDDPNSLDLMPPVSLSYFVNSLSYGTVYVYWKNFRQTAWAKTIVALMTAPPSYNTIPTDSGVSVIYNGTSEMSSVGLTYPAYTWNYTSDYGRTYYLVFWSANASSTSYSRCWSNSYILMSTLPSKKTNPDYKLSIKGNFSGRFLK